MIELHFPDDELDRLAERVADLITTRLQPPADEWLTTRQAAGHLGMSVDALHKLTAGRQIPVHQDRPGARCWFRRSELDEWRA